MTLTKLFIGLIMLALAACSHTKPPVTPPVVVPPVVTTFGWNRVTNADDYRVYLCWTPACPPVVPRTEIVPQTPVGTEPTFRIDLTGSVGAIAVTARNARGESGFSNVLRFDRR